MERDVLTNGLLCALDLRVFAVLQPHLTHADFRRGDVLCEPGEPVEHVCFPHRGVLALLSRMGSGPAIETATIGRESATGLLAGLAPLRSFSRIVGQSHGHLSRIEASRLRSIAAAEPELREIIVRHCDAQFAHAQQSVACNALHGVEARFSRWLLTCHDRTDGDELPATQEFLAMMLGVQRTTVTQAAGALQDAGLIHSRRGRITILDRDGLEQRACECYRTVRQYAEHALPESPAPGGPCPPLGGDSFPYSPSGPQDVSRSQVWSTASRG